MQLDPEERKDPKPTSPEPDGEDQGDGDEFPGRTGEERSDDQLSDEQSERLAHDQETDRIKREQEEETS